MISFLCDRVRSFYESRRPRSLRSPFGDTEARPGSSQGCCKESPSTWAETKAAETRTRLPRFNRQGLIKSRLPHLAGNLRVGQPLSNNLGQRKIKSVCTIHWAMLGCAIVVAERLFIQIAEQVERLDADVAPFHPTLQEAPEVFEAVGERFHSHT